MEAVTDSVFRRVIARAGRPDIMFTEFVNVEGLNSIGSDRVGKRLDFTDDEKPLIAQVWGSDPANFTKTAQHLVQLGFDGIDINMGCPDKNVVKKGLCSALVNNRELASAIIKAVQKGAAGQVPVSVKIRIGYNKPVTKDWVTFLLEHEIDALTIHGRTTKEMSKVPADWDEIAKAVEIRDQLKVATKIIGNGDVMSRAEALHKVEQYGVDGVMIGRGVFANPWLFNPAKDLSDITIQDRLDLLLYHCQLYQEHSDPNRPFHTLKRFFKIYIQGFDGAKELRVRLMDTKSVEDVVAVLKTIT